jgi:ribonuclease Z
MTDRMKVTFLGTGAAAPSLSRGLPALAVQRENKIVLCDCGEGTQMQIQRAGLPPTKIHTILISHLHGDHVLGLPGFISSQQLMGRTSPLTVYGPSGIKQFLNCLMLVSKYEPDFPFDIIELDEHSEQSFPISDFKVTTKLLLHSTPCLGFRLQEDPKPGVFDAAKADLLQIPNGPKRAALQRGENIRHNGREILSEEIVGPVRAGRSIVYCTDTRPCDAGIDLSRNCDLLIHDATFSDAYAVRAEPTMHSTGREAAIIARTAAAKKLALWHLSIRLRGEEETNLINQARLEFENSHLPEDLDSLDVQRPGVMNES